MAGKEEFMFKKLALVLLLGIFAIGAVVAWDGYVDITNKTGYTIYYIYVSHHTSSGWEDDMLGSEVLANGDTIRITLTGYSDSIFDIKCVDEDDDSYTFWGVNCATDDVTVTLSDLD